MNEYRFRRPDSVEALWRVTVEAPRLSTVTELARAEIGQTNSVQLALVPLRPETDSYRGRFFFATATAAEFFVTRTREKPGLSEISPITLTD